MSEGTELGRCPAMTLLLLYVFFGDFKCMSDERVVRELKIVRHKLCHFTTFIHFHSIFFLHFSLSIAAAKFNDRYVWEFLRWVKRLCTSVSCWSSAATGCHWSLVWLQFSKQKYICNGNANESAKTWLRQFWKSWTMHFINVVWCVSVMNSFAYRAIKRGFESNYFRLSSRTSVELCGTPIVKPHLH